MKTTSILFVLLCTSVFAQDAAQPAAASAQNNQQNAPMRFPAGTMISAELQKTVDAHKAKSGDKVEAVVPADLQAKSGEVIIPKGTKVLGHVTEVKQKSKEAPGSTLGIVFEKLAMKDGRELPFDAEIQAVRKSIPQNAFAAASSGSSANESSGMPAGGGSGSGPGARTGNTGGGTAAGGSSYPGAAPAGSSDNPGASQAASNVPPQLNADSKGPIGFEDMSMQQAADGTTLSSQKQNVKLESGTQMILRSRK
jgi:hypothetical protein